MTNNGAIQIRTNAAALLASLSDVQKRQLPFITAVALTRSGQDVKTAEESAIRTIFSNPTRWTQNSLFLRPATKTNLTASVGFKDYASGSARSPANYLQHSIEGTKRGHKAFERSLIRAGVMLQNQYAIPTKRAPLDSYGNVTGAFITRMLSQLSAMNDPLANFNPNSKRSARKGLRFFALTHPTNGMPAGIYERQTAKFSVLIFVYGKQPQYRAIWNFHEIAHRKFAERFPFHFSNEAAKAASSHNRR